MRTRGQSLRREEMPGCGGFLWRRRTPGHFLWTLSFSLSLAVVSAFLPSFLFFKVTFISVSQCLPHPTPTHGFCAPISLLLPQAPQRPGLPRPCPPPQAGAGGGDGERPSPCAFPHSRRGEVALHRPERPGRGYPNLGSQLSFSGPQAPHL